MNMLKAETASMESLLESGVLGEAEAAHLEAQLSGKRSETEQMQKELERLISGQLRQRKFREKMKKMNAAAAAAASQGQYQEAKWCWYLLGGFVGMTVLRGWQGVVVLANSVSN